MITVSVKLLGAYSSLSRDPVLLNLEEGSTVRDLVDALTSRLGRDFKDSLVDPLLGKPSARSLILVGGVEISAKSGLLTTLLDNDEVYMIPVSHGG